MAHLSIKDVPEAWAQQLRLRASRNHRSLQGELMALLEQAVQALPPPPVAPCGPGSPAPSPQAQAVPGQPAKTRGWKTIEQIAQDISARHPGGLPSGPSSIALVREDRDAR